MACFCSSSQFDVLMCCGFPTSPRRGQPSWSRNNDIVMLFSCTAYRIVQMFKSYCKMVCKMCCWCGVHSFHSMIFRRRSRSLECSGDVVNLLCWFVILSLLMLSSVGCFFYPLFWLWLFWLCLARMVREAKSLIIETWLLLPTLKNKLITARYLFSFSHGRNLSYGMTRH